MKYFNYKKLDRLIFNLKMKIYSKKLFKPKNFVLQFFYILKIIYTRYNHLMQTRYNIA